MHICGFDLDVVNMEDDSFFLEDRFSAFDRDLKNKKIMVPMNPGGAWTDPRAPQLKCYHFSAMTNPSCNAAYKAKDITSENVTHKIILLCMVLFMICIYRYAV